MAKKKPKGPPDLFRKFMEERQQGMHKGLTPTPEHATSIWDTSYIPDRYTPATTEQISESEERLGVVFPDLLKSQLLIQNGGYLPDCDSFPFEDKGPWTNATVDGIEQVQEWRHADEDHWFDNAEDVADLHLLVRIAAHSESQLCLDYRKSGNSGIPAITYVDVCMNPTKVIVVSETADDFIRALVALRPSSEGA